MYEFSLLDLSKEKFIAVVNEENGSTIDHTQVVLSGKEDPSPSSDTDGILTITPAPGSKYKGSKELKFKRLDPVKLVAMFGGNLAVSLPTTKEVALETLKQRHGIVIDPESEVRFMDPNDKHLMVIDNHFALSAPMVINLVPLSPMLSEFLTDPELGNINYNITGHEDNWNVGNTGYLMLRNRLYGVDFTPWVETSGIEFVDGNWYDLTNEQVDSLVKFSETKLELNQSPDVFTGGLYGSTAVALAVSGSSGYGAMPGFTHFILLRPKGMEDSEYYMLHFNRGEK